MNNKKSTKKRFSLLNFALSSESWITNNLSSEVKGTSYKDMKTAKQKTLYLLELAALAAVLAAIVFFNVKTTGKVL